MEGPTSPRGFRNRHYAYPFRVHDNEVEMKLSMSLQGRVLLTSLWDQSQTLQSQGRILGRGSRIGYLNSTWCCNKVLLALRGRLGNWSWTPASLLRLGYCPLTECNPGLLTGHNTLRRCLYLMRLIESSLFRKCRTGINLISCFM